jgi:hypothetical protein
MQGILSIAIAYETRRRASVPWRLVSLFSREHVSLCSPTMPRVSNRDAGAVPSAPSAPFERQHCALIAFSADWKSNQSCSNENTSAGQAAHHALNGDVQKQSKEVTQK